MSVRITSGQLYAQSATNLQAIKANLAKLQNQASSGSAIQVPSDDPAGTATSLRLRAEQAANTQYASNISNGQNWLNTADTTLTSAENALTSAISDTIQGATGTNTATSRESIATELDGLKSTLLNLANTQYQGRSIFAGTSNSSTAFDTSTYAYSGDTTTSVTRAVSASQTVQVDTDGATAFGTGSSSVFATIDSITTALRAGSDTTAVSAGLTSLQNQLQSMLTVHASVGSRLSQLNAAATANSTEATSLTSQRSAVEDVDTTSTYLSLKTAELSYQAALSVTAQSIQPTLMSYLQ